MHTVPFFKTPLTDLTGVVVTSQNHGNCRDLEMKLVNCMEAYGKGRGMEKCADLLSDYYECFHREKQNQRIYEMMKERNRQYKAGERTKDDLYSPPPREDAVH